MSKALAKKIESNLELVEQYSKEKVEAMFAPKEVKKNLLRSTRRRRSRSTRRSSLSSTLRRRSRLCSHLRLSKRR